MKPRLGGSASPHQAPDCRWSTGPVVSHVHGCLTSRSRRVGERFPESCQPRSDYPSGPLLAGHGDTVRPEIPEGQSLTTECIPIPHHKHDRAGTYPPGILSLHRWGDRERGQGDLPVAAALHWHIRGRAAPGPGECRQRRLDSPGSSWDSGVMRRTYCGAISTCGNVRRRRSRSLSAAAGRLGPRPRWSRLGAATPLGGGVSAFSLPAQHPPTWPCHPGKYYSPLSLDLIEGWLFKPNTHIE